jgi:hypothetical protein
MIDECKKRISYRKGKTYKEIFGEEKSIEMKKKSSQSHSGQHSSVKTEFKKGLIPWNKGKKGLQVAWNKGKKWSEWLSEECAKNSVANLVSAGWNKGLDCPQWSGENNGNWNGGSSFEPYGREFNRRLKEQIRMRDNYRCQECFRHQDELYTKKGKKYKLIVHHIDYDKKNNNPDNLISLCRSCHLQTNYERNDWTDYFQNKLLTIND